MCLPPLTLQSGWLTGQGCALDPYILADIQGKVKGFSETFVICYPERRVPVAASVDVFPSGLPVFIPFFVQVDENVQSAAKVLIYPQKVVYLFQQKTSKGMVKT